MWRVFANFGKAAVCQPSKFTKTRQYSPNPSLQLPGATQAFGKPFLQLQQVPEAVAVSFHGVQGCSLQAFKTRQNSPKLAKPFPGGKEPACFFLLPCIQCCVTALRRMLGRLAFRAILLDYSPPSKLPHSEMDRSHIEYDYA